MVIEINNVMVEIQTTNNIFFLLVTPSLKNVTTSSTNEEKEK
jgi:hypothetical protein